ncbi:MAG: adenylate/guanylate cyclase domain-containing protein [Rhodospirillaceae bacterium]|nr:adenylate/guanylate cyclase domain-containing protein [Rhodospirillaceae bacterium]
MANEERKTRRLMAILSADVVGYSRLMEANEAGTLAALKRHRAELIDPKIAQYGGRVVSTAGDGLLCEFPSVIDAVQCAVEIQATMPERNADIPDDRRMQLRIGINLGDVIVEGDDIFGDGVNVAARLETLAEPGGICVSGTVHEHAASKLPYAFEDLGRQTVKNIARPIHAWRVKPAAGAARGMPAGMTEPLPLPDKPSIAVLPFTNMSSDPDQEYFADGISEDLITALSKIRWFFVIARNSTFVYKGQPVDIKEVGDQLGVRYVLEGSVRKSGTRIRITAQLIEAATNRHVWAERYDRDIGDMFALQNEMSEMIANAIEPELSNAERERAARKVPGHLDAWALYQRGLWHHYRFTEADNCEAKRLFGKAIAADPQFAAAYAGLAHACYWDALFGFRNASVALAEGFEKARLAVSLDDNDPLAHFAMGRVQTLRCEFADAVGELGRAIELNPNFAHAHYGLGWALILSGRPDAALERIDTAIRLNPRDPSIWTFLGGRALALFLLGQREEAAKSARRSAQSAVAIYLPHVIEAAILADLGRDREAAAAMAMAREINSALSGAMIETAMPLQNPAHRDLYMSSLRKAGLKG